MPALRNRNRKKGPGIEPKASASPEELGAIILAGQQVRSTSNPGHRCPYATCSKFRCAGVCDWIGHMYKIHGLEYKSMECFWPRCHVKAERGPGHIAKHLGLRIFCKECGKDYGNRTRDFKHNHPKGEKWHHGILYWGDDPFKSRELVRKFPIPPKSGLPETSIDEASTTGYIASNGATASILPGTIFPSESTIPIIEIESYTQEAAADLFDLAHSQCELDVPSILDWSYLGANLTQDRRDSATSISSSGSDLFLSAASSSQPLPSPHVASNRQSPYLQRGAFLYPELSQALSKPSNDRTCFLSDPQVGTSFGYDFSIPGTSFPLDNGDSFNPTLDDSLYSVFDSLPYNLSDNSPAFPPTNITGNDLFGSDSSAWDPFEYNNF